jgi:hypothetical protein
MAQTPGEGDAPADDLTTLQKRVSELERSNAECYDQLHQAQEKLAHLQDVQESFIATVSQEVRTPLHVILGYSESLGDAIYGSLNARQSEALQAIADNGLHLLRLLDTTLDLLRLQTGRLQLAPTPILLAQVCQASVQAMQEQAQRKNIRLVLQAEAAAVTIAVDALRLEQVLMYLLARAIRHTPREGAVLLEAIASAEEGAIRLGVRDMEPSLANGAAPQELLPFSQMRRPFEYLGLELALVAALVEQFGGSMQQLDQQGGNMTVLLPYQPAA